MYGPWYEPGATAGVDYTASSGTLTIPAGATSGRITVAIRGDRVVDPAGTFALDLTSPSGATVANGQAIGTIRDDDGYVPPPLPPAWPPMIDPAWQ